MNQPQRSLSNLGMSKSQTISQNRIGPQVHSIKEMTKVDWISSWPDMKSSREIIIQNSVPTLQAKRIKIFLLPAISQGDELILCGRTIQIKNSYNPRPNYNNKHLQTQQYEYDRDFYKKDIKQDSPIKVELSYTAPNTAKKGVVSDTAAYLRERETIMNSFMTQEEIQRIKRVYYRK